MFNKKTKKRPRCNEAMNRKWLLLNILRHMAGDGRRLWHGCCQTVTIESVHQPDAIVRKRGG